MSECLKHLWPIMKSRDRQKSVLFKCVIQLVNGCCDNTSSALNMSTCYSRSHTSLSFTAFAKCKLLNAFSFRQYICIFSLLEVGLNSVSVQFRTTGFVNLAHKMFPQNTSVTGGFCI